MSGVTVTWKAVTEEMPDADSTVLIYSKDADEPVWIGYFDGEYWRDAGSSLRTKVTHWAQFPDPPIT